MFQSSGALSHLISLLHFSKKKNANNYNDLENKDPFSFCSNCSCSVCVVCLYFAVSIAWRFTIFRL